MKQVILLLVFLKTNVLSMPLGAEYSPTKLGFGFKSEPYATVELAKFPNGYQYGGIKHSSFILPVTPTTLPPEANVKTAPDSNGSFAVFGLKAYGREEAAHEKESIISKVDTLYGRAQELFPVQPVVDTAKESEKYGNDGKFSTITGNTVVGAFEIFSNLVNGAIELPKVAGAKFMKKLNFNLGALGSQLVG